MIEKIKDKLQLNIDSKKYLVFFIVTLIMLFPISIYNIEAGKYFIYLPGIVILYSLIKYFPIYRKEAHIKYFTYMIGFSVISLIFKQVDILNFILSLLTMMAMALLFFKLTDYNYKIFYEVLYDYSFIILILNAIIGLLFQDGITIVNVIMPLHLLGVGNQITPFILLYLTIIISRYIIYKDNLLALILSIFATLVSLYFADSATGYIGTFIYFLVFATFMLYNKYLKKGKEVKNRAMIILVFIIILHAMVIFFDFQTLFEGFITGVLEKDTTLTTRTMIWDEAIKIIKKSFIFGNGMPSIDSHIFSRFNGYSYGTHNIFLEITLIGGFTTIILFLMSTYKSLKNIFLIDNSSIRAIIMAYFLSFFVMSITEVYTIIIIVMVFILPNLFIKFNERSADVQ